MRHSPSKEEIEKFIANTYKDIDGQTYITSDYWNDFVAEIKEIDQKRKSDTKKDFKHFKTMKLWGRIVSILGYATAWIIPNPISAALIGFGNYARWSLVFHPVSHGALNHMKEIPKRYKSNHFAYGWRRCVDWLDWIGPKNWNVEHNILHHHYLGTSEDPDIVSRNTSPVREFNISNIGKVLFLIFLASTWKFTYYAPNTLIEFRNYHKISLTNKITLNLWNPFVKEGREIWLRSMIPYFMFRFVFIPSMFLAISSQAALYVLINSIFAEILTNIYSFCTIATNHTGDDILTFEGRAVNSADYYLRQILGTVNYPSRSNFEDFMYGGMNFQIEHHIWSNASVYQCKKFRPKLIKICEKYGIPYREEPLSKRIIKLVRAIVVPEGSEMEVLNSGELKCSS